MTWVGNDVLTGGENQATDRGDHQAHERLHRGMVPWHDLDGMARRESLDESRKIAAE